MHRAGPRSVTSSPLTRVAPGPWEHLRRLLSRGSPHVPTPHTKVGKVAHLES
ncbi:unnamed protein product, partial [Gulo gulo]